MKRRTVVFAALREPAYVRNLLVLRNLRRLGLNVIECTSDRRTYAGRAGEVLLKVLQARLRARPDVIYAGFLAQPLVPVLRLLFPGTHLIVDAFVSVFDTLCLDRRRVAEGSIIGQAAWWSDRIACRLADVLVADTPASGRLFRRLFKYQGHLEVLPVGADEATFFPRSSAIKPRVFYYSNGLPVHGLQVVREAAAHLEKEGVEFLIVGAGSDSGPWPSNVRLRPWLPTGKLAKDAAESFVCLGGHFALSAKARNVVAGKTYQFLALGRPTIVTRGDGNEWLLSPGVDAIFCNAGSAEGLASAVRAAFANPPAMEELGSRGRETFLQKASEQKLLTALEFMLQFSKEASYDEREMLAP